MQFWESRLVCWYAMHVFNQLKGNLVLNQIHAYIQNLCHNGLNKALCELIHSAHHIKDNKRYVTNCVSKNVHAQTPA